MTLAALDGPIGGAMRLFEIYPPSSFLLSVALAVVLTIGGLQLAVIFTFGFAVAKIAGWLDSYGI